jgi:hypothetical protein
MKRGDEKCSSDPLFRIRGNGRVSSNHMVRRRGDGKAFSDHVFPRGSTEDVILRFSQRSKNPVFCIETPCSSEKALF